MLPFNEHADLSANREWTEFAIEGISKRSQALMSTVNDDAILILGGMEKSDGVLYNPQTQQVTRKMNVGTFDYTCEGN